MLPKQHDVDEFIESVSDVARLIDCLKAGTISTDYVDCKIQANSRKQQASKAGPGHNKPFVETSNCQDGCAEAAVNSCVTPSRPSEEGGRS